MATAFFNQPLDIDAILKFSPSAEYKPEEFPGLVYRLTKPKTVALIFSSGKMICIGARSERQAKSAISRIIHELEANGISIVGKPEVKVVNVVASIDFGGRIDLESSAGSLRKTIYEPEQFPGLIYRMDEPNVTMLLFSSGKSVCTGAREEKDVVRAGKALQKTLESKGLISYE